MANWLKVITSGSTAQLSSLALDTPLPVNSGGTGLNATSASGFLVGTNSTTYTTVGSNGSGQVLRTIGAVGVNMSGSFSGSFIGSGAGLTGLFADSTFSVSGSLNGFSFQTATDTLQFTTASLHGFDLSASFASTRKVITLLTPQDLRTSASPTFAGLTLSGLSGGTTDTVLTLNGSNVVTTRTIDGRVWGSSLVDGSGSTNRLAFWSDANTVVSDANLTYNGTILSVNGSTFGNDVTIAGNLTILGEAVIANVANISVEDKFIYLNSGSLTGDGGFIVASGSAGSGVAFGWDDSVARWGIQQNTFLAATATTFAPEAYVASVVDVDNGMTDVVNYRKNGNIKIQGGEIYIYA